VATTQRVTKALATECPDCNGFGYTQNTCPEMVIERGREKRTLQQGSGCPRCLGTGQIHEAKSA
jgi:RecJ-like exonuclease